MERHTISCLGRAVQVSSAVFFGSSECLLLAAMTSDRFMAICDPLLYSTKMSTQLNSPTLVSAPLQVSPRRRLAPLLWSRCVRAASYICILITILKMCSTKGRHKAFSTCTSHLTAVTLCYRTNTLIYVMPKSSYSTDQNKVVVSVFYMVVIPILNPLIYSLRKSEMKAALKRELGKAYFMILDIIICCKYNNKKDRECGLNISVRMSASMELFSQVKFVNQRLIVCYL
ncbi:seven transmembrane helix receptor [Lynx pardinus]|uniref:Seven transmembrane helix receptor n=1 Tax=Lynx pardinus TaxID=191816 RepID=A0A485NZM2_LYNPA|nr:seven transmembrane helix receptor [Lynx pardinus]